MELKHWLPLLVVCFQGKVSSTILNSCESYLSSESSDLDSLKLGFRNYISHALGVAANDHESLGLLEHIAKNGFENMESRSLPSKAGVLRDSFVALKKQLTSEQAWVESFIREELAKNLNELRSKNEHYSHLIDASADFESVHRFLKVKNEAAIDGRSVSLNIKKMGISDPLQLFEIAQIAFEQNGEGAAEYVQNYGIIDQANLLQLAMIAVHSRGARISSRIQNFGIIDSDSRYEVAKIMAKRNAWDVSYYIKNYRLMDSKQRCEVAKIAALQGASFLTDFFENYEISDEEDLFEIAKIAINEDPASTSQRIYNFRMKNSKHRFEIAKMAAQKNGEAVSEYIKNYDLTQKERLEIVKIAIEQDAVGTSKYFANYEFDDALVRFRFAGIAIMKIPLKHIDYLRNYKISDFAQIEKLKKIYLQRREQEKPPVVLETGPQQAKGSGGYLGSIKLKITSLLKVFGF